jgi:hypothetical protein
MAIKIQRSIRTLRLKVKAEGYAWLNAAAVEVNQVWNFANATSCKAARPFAGPASGSPPLIWILVHAAAGNVVEVSARPAAAPRPTDLRQC